MSKYFCPRKGERREPRGERSGFGEARTLLRCPAASQALVEAQAPLRGGRSLPQSSQRVSALQGHLSCPAPSTPAAPHPSFPASSTAKAAPCCLAWCPPDMGSSRSHTGAQRREGMVIPPGHLGGREDPLKDLCLLLCLWSSQMPHSLVQPLKM